MGLLLGSLAYESFTPVSAAPGAIPDGSYTGIAVGGRIKVGSGAQAIDSAFSDPGRPLACADGVDNETINDQPNPATDSAKDGLIDFPADPQCSSAADDDEVSQLTGNFGGTQNTAACDNQINFAPDPQPRKDWSLPISIAGSSISMNPALAQIPTDVLQVADNSTIPGVILQVQQSIKPIAFNTEPPNGTGCTAGNPNAGANFTTNCTSATNPDYAGKTDWYGTNNPDGSGTIHICAYLDIEVKELSATLVPDNIMCRTPAFPIDLTTETDGGSTGIRYDGATNDVTMVSESFTIPDATNAFGDGLGLVCPNLNSQVGLPSAPPNNALRMDISLGGTDVDPVPSATTVNEGDVVSVYDLAERTLTVSSGPSPAVIKHNLRNNEFVAPDSSGADVITLDAPMCATGENDSLVPQSCPPAVNNEQVSITVNNVAPTANAGPDVIVDGGTNVDLRGTSTDPGDPEGQRSYCWTQTGGTSVGLPGCPNFKNQTFAAPNADGVLNFQLVVTDDDGAASTADTVQIQTRATTSGELSGVATFRDAGGSDPLPGARARLYDGTTGAYVATTTADGNGKYTFSGLSDGATYKVYVDKSGYLGAYAGTPYGDNTVNINLRKSQAQVFTVPSSTADAQLTDSTTLGSISGTTEANTSVLVYAADGRYIGGTTSDGSGAYSVGGLPAGGFAGSHSGLYKLKFGVASPPVYMPQWYGTGSPLLGLNAADAALVPIDAASPNVTGIDQSLTLLGDVANIDVNVSGPAPADGDVDVRLFRADGGYAKNARGPAGTVSIKGLIPADYTVWVWTKYVGAPAAIQAYQSEWYNDLVGEQFDGTGLIADPVTLTGGATANLNVTLAP